MTRLIGFALLLALLGLSVPARAGDVPNEAAAEHYRSAQAHAKRGEYPEALAEFERAYAIEPDAIVLCNIGQTSVPLGRSQKALDALRQCLAGGGTQLPPAYRASVERQIALLESSFAALTVTTDPPGAHVTVDGAEVGTTPLAEPVRVAAGTHVVSASRPGATVETRVVSVVEGQRENVSLAVPDAPAVPSAPSAAAVDGAGMNAAPAPPAPVVAPRAESAPFPTAYVLLGAGVVLGGVTVGHYIWNHGRVDDYRAAEAELATDTAPPNRHELQVENNELGESIQHASVVTVSLGVASGALVAAGVVLLVTEHHAKSAHERASTAKHRFQPPDVAVTRDSLRLSWGGTW